MAGKRVKNDIRNQLVFSYIDFIEMVRPKLLLFENVKGFTYAFNKANDSQEIPYSEIVKNKLKELGYGVQAQVVDFSTYGIPQRRKRFIMVGILGKPDDVAKLFFQKLESQKKTFFKEKNLRNFVV